MCSDKTMPCNRKLGNSKEVAPESGLIPSALIVRNPYEASLDAHIVVIIDEQRVDSGAADAKTHMTCRNACTGVTRPPFLQDSLEEDGS